MATLFYKLAIALLILLPCSALGVRLGLWHYSIGLALCSLSLVGSFAIQIIHSIWLLKKPPAATKRILRRTSLIALPPLLVAASVIRDAGQLPMIHDISTDTDNPPVFVQLVEARGTDSNALTIDPDVIRQQRQAYPHLQPLTSSLSPAQALTKAYEISQQLGWDIYALDKQGLRLEATATSLWFGFVDDIVVRVRPQSTGSVIDLRSVSRVGQGDLGANARRIKAFMKAFKQEQ
jgi:uncharacterized protein (DUF1499 family)